MSLFQKLGPYTEDRIMPEHPMREVNRAQTEGRDAVFHGCCIGCAWKKGNSTGPGLQWCMECTFFDFNENKRNLRTPMPQVDAVLQEDY